jgi:hypothetical protein
MILSEDILSHCKADVVYGLKGDEVLLVADYGNVFIVEDKGGKRFPVHESKLVKELQVVEVQELNPDPVKSIATVFNQAPPVKTKKKVPVEQQTLF